MRGQIWRQSSHSNRNTHIAFVHVSPNRRHGNACVPFTLQAMPEQKANAGAGPVRTTPSSPVVDSQPFPAPTHVGLVGSMSPQMPNEYMVR